VSYLAYENPITLHISLIQYPRDYLHDECDLGSQHLHYEQQQQQRRTVTANGSNQPHCYALP
jgi:hypothetical protein